MADNTRNIDRLLQREYRERERITALKDALKHHRYHGALQKNHLMERLARAERAFHSIYKHLLDLGESSGYSLYQRQVHTRRNGLNVTVELSLDGFSFSNPAPAVPNNAPVWVRAKIEENHTGVLGIPKSHLMLHVTWVYSSKYTKEDNVVAAGRDEFMVSNPFIITRLFKAPASGSTKHNFFVYVDQYDPVG